jgi:hypothetical protein
LQQKTWRFLSTTFRWDSSSAYAARAWILASRERFLVFSEKSALKFAAYFGFENAGGLPRAAGNKFVVHALLQICCADIGEIKA